MARKAYFVISVDEEFYQNRYQDVLRDLKAVPEVESIERISGTCDLMVKVEAPIRVIFIVNKILAKEWVKRLYMLKVEPFGIDEYQGLTVDDLLRLKRVIPEEAARELQG